MTRRVVLATRNAGKVAELRRILEAAGLDVELVGAEAFASLPDVAETALMKDLVDTYGTNLYSAYAFSKAKDHSAALEKINGALNELLDDGTVSELSKKFFGGLDVTPRR